jgi:ATP-dependent RNA helicase DeaD
MKKLEWLDREELIKKFVSVEFNRFLEYYKNSSDLNKPEEGKRGNKGRNTSEGFTRFFLNLGKTDNLTPVTVIGMIKDYSGIKDIDIGGIDILQNFSFFETDSSYDDLLLKGFNGKQLKKRKIVLEVASAKREDNRKPKSGRRSFSKNRRTSGKKNDFEKPRRRRRK